MIIFIYFFANSLSNGFFLLYLIAAGRTSAISVFRKNMNAVIQDVCFNLLTYYETVSAPSSIDGRIRPVFSYPMATPKSMGKASMEIPTLGSLIAFVRDIAMLLIESVDEYSMLRSMSQDVSKVPYETLKEVCFDIFFLFLNHSQY